jgi:crotonobetainyl-CoA:carnitine CoA-transferase CaiB-like acyl-CoA transferase
VNEQGGPLSGVVIVALEQAVSAPMCTRTLADLGARVIKIENPRGGDFARTYDDVVHGTSAHFTWANRGKESVTLNLKSAEGMAVLRRLLERADVLVSNLAPGVTAKLGLAPADLAERVPDLISLEIDGFGRGGPLSHKRAYDLLIQAESGACAITGFPGVPVKPGPPLADVTCGLYAALTIMAMLRDRDRGVRRSEGARSGSVSLLDTMTEVMGYALTHARHTGADTDPVGMGSPAVAPYGAYATRDGFHVVLGTTNDREWQRLALQLLARPDLAADDRYATNARRSAPAARGELDAAIGAWCAAHDLDEIQALADEANIGNSRLNRPTEVVEHPHLVERGRVQEVDVPGGTTRAFLPPPVIAGYTAPMRAVPALGGDTDTVLAELGFDDTEVAALREAGGIGPDPRSAADRG